MKRVFEINTIGPALVAKHFLALLPREGKSIFAALSARVGSISDNNIGGWHSYRASKAALNMVLKNVAIETARKYKDTAVIGLHPGTVDTGLSLPFQRQVEADKLFSPEKSVHYLLNVLNKIDSKDTGKIFAWDGKEIQA
jgi:NAD(P)-dependent dehydrogenase (short-subunit alcohol dehydrogenase family)